MNHLLLLSRKNLLLRLMLLACLVTLFGLVFRGDGPTAHATSMQGLTLANPAGKWNTQVFFQDCSYQGETESGQLQMNSSGALVAYSPYAGGGAWLPTGTSTFDYSLTEFILVNGQLVAFVVVTQDAQMTSSTRWTSSGSGDSYDSQGNYLETCHTQTTATLAS